MIHFYFTEHHCQLWIVNDKGPFNVQGELEGGRNRLWQCKEKELLCLYQSNVVPTVKPT